MKFPFKFKGLPFGKKRRGGNDDDDDEDDGDEYEDEEDGAAEPERGDGGEDDDEDYDEDEDEEGGGGLSKVISAILGEGRRRLIILGAAGLVVLLAVGGLTTMLLVGGGDEETVAGAEAGGDGEGGAADDPNRPQLPLKSKREEGTPYVEMDIPRPRRGGSSAERSLNVLAAADQGTSADAAVPWVTLAAFEGVPLAAIATALSEAPDLALIEQGSQGPLPKVGEDGRRPWQVYARPFDEGDARPRIAVIITGLGLSRAATEAAISLLPGEVTLAFDPYATGLGDWVRLARQAGHEVLISLPMESAAFPVHDSGPQSLMTWLDPAENLNRLEFVLSRLSGYVGVVTVMGSKFTTTETHLRPILEVLKARGLLIVDGGKAPKTLVPRIATEIGLPRALSNMVLDTVASRVAIDGKLAKLEALARKHAAAVATATPYPVSVERLVAWAATLEGKNLVLAPVSAIADKQILE